MLEGTGADQTQAPCKQASNFSLSCTRPVKLSQVTPPIAAFERAATSGQAWSSGTARRARGATVDIRNAACSLFYGACLLVRSPIGFSAAPSAHCLHRLMFTV